MSFVIMIVLTLLFLVTQSTSKQLVGFIEN